MTLSIHREGYKFIGIGLSVSLIFLLFCHALFWISLLITIGIALFFRNPRRAVPKDDNLIVSPADGTICNIVYEEPPEELELGKEKRYRISIFLSLFDVHINRVPMSGKIKKVIYTPGQFIDASVDKSSLCNERNTIVLQMNNTNNSDAQNDNNKKSTNKNIETENNITQVDNSNCIAFSQIAGKVARRIVCDVHDGQEIQKGEVFGLIRFGSRNDVWLPVGAVPQVYVGQTSVAGETVLSDLSQKDIKPRECIIVQ